MLVFTIGVIALSNAEFAILLGTCFLSFCFRTICKEIAKYPKVSNVSLRTMDIEKTRCF